MWEIMPRDNIMPSDFYDMKKLVDNLGLPVIRIDVCSRVVCYIREIMKMQNLANSVDNLSTRLTRGRIIIKNVDHANKCFICP